MIARPPRGRRLRIESDEWGALRRGSSRTTIPGRRSHCNGQAASIGCSDPIRKMPVMKLRLSRRRPGNATNRLEQVVLGLKPDFKRRLIGEVDVRDA